MQIEDRGMTIIAFNMMMNIASKVQHTRLSREGFVTESDNG